MSHDTGNTYITISTFGGVTALSRDCVPCGLVAVVTAGRYAGHGRRSLLQPWAKQRGFEEQECWSPCFGALPMPNIMMHCPACHGIQVLTSTQPVCDAPRASAAGGNTAYNHSYHATGIGFSLHTGMAGTDALP
jgi:hypothetical protein